VGDGKLLIISMTVTADEDAAVKEGHNLAGRFLSFTDCIRILNDDNRTGLDRCPDGLKEDTAS